MHELTVAAQIRSTLERELVPEADAVAVDVVRVQVGALTGLVPEALEFVWPHAVADSSLLGHAAIEVELVEAAIECGACGSTSTTAVVRALRCPVCRSPDIQVVGGDELDIVSIDVSDRGTAVT